MVNFFKSIFFELSYLEISLTMKYLLVGISAVIVIIFFVILLKLRKIISFNGSYTLRAVTSARRIGEGNKLKKFAQYTFLVDSEKDGLWFKILSNNRMDLEKAGIYSLQNLMILIFLKWLAVPLMVLIVIVSRYFIVGGQPVVYGLMTFALGEGAIWFVILTAIKNESDKFKTASYTLFKFLRNQISAGIKIPNALGSLHGVVSDPVLKERLILMSSHYASTNDIDRALDYITTYYPTMEAKSLALSIKQAIETGRMDSGFEQKEKKLFNMYLNVIKKNTQVLMLKFVLVASLYALVIILMVGYPQLLDLMEANKMIFGR